MASFAMSKERVLAILFLEEHMDWVFIALSAACVSLYVVGHVFSELATVRPLLFFVLVDGAPPPVCGFSVLFGT